MRHTWHPTVIKWCPHCRSRLYGSGEANEYSCLMCGQIVFVGAPPRMLLDEEEVAQAGPRKRGRPRKTFAVA